MRGVFDILNLIIQTEDANIRKIRFNKMDEKINTFQLYEAQEFLSSSAEIDTDKPLFLEGTDSALAPLLRKKLAKAYGEDYTFYTKTAMKYRVQDIANVPDNSTLLFYPVPLKDKARYNTADLLRVMDKLMGEGGCPWDRAQTHETIRTNALEEAYEVIDAIDRRDNVNLREECGDLLLQAVFHAYISDKNGGFDYSDMIDALCKKLISRHRHLFGAVDMPADADGALDVWEQSKKLEKKFETVGEEMSGLPAVFPQLLRAHKIQKKAAKEGFDFSSVEEALGKAQEELDELRAAISDGKNVSMELGDCLFSLVNVSRFVRCDPELALKESADKFIRRFTYVEQRAREGGGFKNFTQEQLDFLFNEYKRARKD